jgi:peptidoglycan lytic transglycosylase
LRAVVVVAVDGIAARMIRVRAILVLSVAVAACSARQPVAPTLPSPSAAGAPPSLTAMASWYGPGFVGQRTSSGEIYTAGDLTAASTVFPLGTRLMVTNLDNGRSVEVRVNDHGPYLKGRELDLSRKAARMLGMIGPGTARVRMDVMSTPAGGPPIGQRYFVQVGSFAYPENARRLRERIAGSYPDVHIDEVTVGTNRYYRVRMGAFGTHGEAEERAAALADNGYRVEIITQ